MSGPGQAAGQPPRGERTAGTARPGAAALASPFSPRSAQRRPRAAAARPLSTAALLDSADDDSDDDDAAAPEVVSVSPIDVTVVEAAPPPPPAKRTKGRARRKHAAKSEQQGPKFSDSGGGGGGELVLSANAILESLARLREQQDSKVSDTTSSAPAGAAAGACSTAAIAGGVLRGDDDKQEAESWRFRRRKAELARGEGPHGPRDSRSYHRDCQEALQSLLWEPYDCRDPKDTPMYQYADDADVSFWLYPRPGLGGLRRGPGEGCRCPCRCALHHSPTDSSSVTSDCSSSSESYPTPPPERETSASSLRGLLTASTSGGSSAADSAADSAAWTTHASGARGHHAARRRRSSPRDQRQLRPRLGLGLVTDLKTPWIGTAAAAAAAAAAADPATQLLSLREAPPAALGSLSPVEAPAAAAAAAASTTTTAPGRRARARGPRQSEAGRAARRTPTAASLTSGSASSASYGPTMLVNVSDDVRDVPRDVPASSAAAAASVSVSSVTVSGSAVSSSAVCGVSSVSVPVPSPSVAAVPTIPCLNNVSNVHILPTGASTVSASPAPRPRPRAAVTPAPGGSSPAVPPPPPPQSSSLARTYASTEAQTDDLEAEGRRERRRERRERRHLRRLQPRHPHPHGGLHGGPPPPAALAGAVQTSVPVPGLPGIPGLAGEPTAGPGGLPDLLHSHLPPPYSTLPLGLPPHMLGPPHGPPLPPLPPPLVAAPPPQHPPPPQPPLGHHRFAAPGLRLPFAFVPASRRRAGRGATYTAGEEPKSCCGVLVGQPVSIRWFILLILLVGLCCAVVGTVLGAMKASGREHLTVSLLMIGVGIVLVTVSGVAWRLTSHDAPSCRVMLGMASGHGDESAAEPNRRFVPRLPPSYGRPHHPYAAMMYPEFQYRPPPPSYQASMQEYRLRLLLLDRHPGAGGGGGIAGAAPAQVGAGTVSPPPTYRSHAGSLLRAPLGCRREVAASEYSRPPSYRSRSSSTRPSLEPGGGHGGGSTGLAGSLAGSLAGALAGALGAAGLHSRTGSVATDHSMSDAGTCPPAHQPVSVISVGGGDSVKCAPDPVHVQEVFTMTGNDPASSALQMMLRKSEDGSPTKDANLVTIVQTSSAHTHGPAPHTRTRTHSTHAQDPSAPVIVTVSGSTTTAVCPDNAEMEILAHL